MKNLQERTRCNMRKNLKNILKKDLNLENSLSIQCKIYSDYIRQNKSQKKKKAEPADKKANIKKNGKVIYKS